MSFCVKCGSQLSPENRFCYACGAPVTSTAGASARVLPFQTDGTAQSAPYPFSSLVAETPPASPVLAASKVITVLPQAKKMKMLGLADVYTIVFTADQAIMARLSNEVVKDVIQKSQARSKAEGKGWLAKVGDQMKAFYNAHVRYLEMIPEEILAENKENFALPHAQVSAVKLRTGFESGGEDGPGDEYTEIEFQATSGKYKYRLSMCKKDVMDIIQKFYPGKIGK
jgi:hypothetical protein